MMTTDSQPDDTMPDTMPDTTAKVFLSGKTPLTDGQTSLVFTADYAEGANKEWAKYTPALQMNMTVLSDIPLAQSEYGDRFTLTFHREDPAT